MKLKILLFLILFAIFFGFSLVLYLNIKLNQKIYFEEEEIEIEIPFNTSTDKLIYKFNEYGFFIPDNLFRYFIKFYLKINDKKFYAGIYTIKNGTSNFELIEILEKGAKDKTVMITFIEGLYLNEVIEKIAPIKTDIQKFEELCFSDSLLKARNIESESVLGYLMPNTYEFFLYEKPEKIIDKMLDAFFEIWDKKRLEKLEKSGLTLHQVITLASIVEGETPLKSESKIVAGLYLNRLNRNMPLQADPTVQFALGKRKRLSRKNLLIDHPYNTYMINGLPPGPINNPGVTAIDGVLEPMKHNYLFMVSTGDGSGKHYYSKTLNEHNNYIIKYKKTKDSLNNPEIEILSTDTLKVIN